MGGQSEAPLTLDDLRRFAVARSLFPPTTLRRALARMGFVQADPVRAPARAQDLILRLRVKARKTTSSSRAEGYRAGDLERHYESLGIEEDFFVNYGFATRAVQAWMHPRPDLREPAEGNQPSSRSHRKKEKMLLDFVEARGPVHPREVEEHFAHGTVQNYWGGSSLATTQMLGVMHYRGLLRVARCGGAPGADRCAGGCGGKHLCTAAGCESVVLRAAAALCGAAMAKGNQRGVAARAGRTGAGAGGWSDLVLA
jgi:uncharacterized protein YcaQ